MSITNAIVSAASGLNLQAKRSETLSGNIANAATPGYAKREVGVTERLAAGQSMGVASTGIQRRSDPQITDERRGAEAQANDLESRAKALEQLARAVGEPGASGSLSAAYARLKRAFADLADNPESQVHQRTVLSSAQDLAKALNQLSTENARIRLNADRKIASEVREVNSALRKLETINGQIRVLTLGRTDTAGLEDERQRLIDQISQRIPVKVALREHGEIMLLTQEGVPLLDGQAAQVTFQAANAVPASSLYNGGAGVLSGLSVNGQDIAPGSGNPQAIRSGSLAGHFAVRDDIGVAFQENIDALAEDLIARFADPTADPSLATGQPGLFTDGGALPGSPVVAGLAGRLAVNAAADPDAGGALWRLRDGLGAAIPGPAGAQDGPRRFLAALERQQMLPTGFASGVAQPAGAAAALFTSFVAQEAAETGSDFDHSSGLAAGLVLAEKNATAVNVDEELQALAQIEQAYAANAMVLQTAEQMMQVLLRI